MNYNIVYSLSATELYSQLAGVSLFSLLENNKHLEGINIYIVESGMLEEQKEKFRQMCSSYQCDLFFLNVQNLLVEIENMGVPKYKGSYQLYVKYFFDKILPQSVEYFLYLDADTYIDGKLDDVYDEFKCRNKNEIVMGGIGLLQGTYREKIGIGFNNPSICVGVLLVDRRRWEENNVGEKFANFIKENGLDKFRQLDEDAFNVAFKDNIKVASLTNIYFPCMIEFKAKHIYLAFNMNKKSFFSIEDIKLRERKGTVIYHFIDFLGKPWENGSKDPMAEKWRKTMRESPWNDMCIDIVPNESFTHFWAKKIYAMSKWAYSILIRVTKK